MNLRNILKIFGIFAIGMFGGIFADQILWPYFVEKPLFFEYGLEKTPVSVVEKKETIIQENTALTEAVERTEKSVIAVKSQSASKTMEGSGLIVTADGLVVTLAELVPQGSSFSFYINNKTANFQVLKRDLVKNLALIKLEESGLPTTGFASPDSLKLGERVFLVGEAIGKIGNVKLVNEGIVRKIDGSSIETNIFEKLSLKGSVLFNIKGEVSGINTINSEGRVVAIPVSIIKEFVGL